MPIRTVVDQYPGRNVAILKIIGELDFDERTEFIKSMKDLIACPERRLVVDLTTITRMSSVFIGTLVDYGHQAKEQDKELAIRIVERMQRVCEETGLSKTVTVLVANGNG